MKLRVYLALLLLCGLARTSRGDSCDHTFPSGHYFNLQSLRSEYPRTNPALVNVQYMGSNYNYMWAPCDTIPNSVCQGNNVLPNAVMCQKDAGGGTTVHNIGSGPTSWQEGSNQIVLTWNNGDPSGSNPRSTQLTITCTPGQPDSKLQADTDSTGDPEHPSLHYNFKWSSGAAWACPQAHPSGDGGSGDSGGLSGGWIFIIVLICVVVLYLVGGVLYQKFRVQAEGIELIPHVRFWFSLPGLVRDGNIYTYQKLRGLCNRGSTYDTA